MIDVETLLDKRFLASVFTALAVMATVATLAAPFLGDDQLSKRLKMVANEKGTDSTA